MTALVTSRSTAIPLRVLPSSAIGSRCRRRRARAPASSACPSRAAVEPRTCRCRSAGRGSVGTLSPARATAVQTPPLARAGQRPSPAEAARGRAARAAMAGPPARAAKRARTTSRRDVPNHGGARSSLLLRPGRHLGRHGQRAANGPPSAAAVRTSAGQPWTELRLAGCPSGMPRQLLDSTARLLAAPGGRFEAAPAVQRGAQKRVQLDDALTQTVDTLIALPGPVSRTLVVFTAGVDQGCNTLPDLMHQAPDPGSEQRSLRAHGAGNGHQRGSTQPEFGARHSGHSPASERGCNRPHEPARVAEYVRGRDCALHVSRASASNTRSRSRQRATARPRSSLV